MSKLISFDIDGTLEVGDPPGIITVGMVREVKELGYLVGSCSDRTISNQRKLWAENELEMDFVVLKHQLDVVKASFHADEYYHIGDTDMDEHFAQRAGFSFILADSDAARVWSPEAPR